MRRIAIINQKGGVGKTTTTLNLGAALALQGRRVVVVDMDAQANLTLALGVEARSGSPTSYTVLLGNSSFEKALRKTSVPNLELVASNLDLSGAELELASAMGREYLLRDALKEWEVARRGKHGKPPADYVLFDCPPSLGLLSINALAAAGEVLITLQTEFLALQGMSKLVDVVQLLRKRLNPELTIVGIAPCLYDSRLKLAREVLGEIRSYFKSQVFPHPIRSNVKLAEAPSFGQSIFEYAPDSNGAVDYMRLAREIIAREERDPDLKGLPPFDEKARLPATAVNAPPPSKRVPPPPKRKVEPPVIAAVTARKPAESPPIAAQERRAPPPLPRAAPKAPEPEPIALAKHVLPKHMPPERVSPKRAPPEQVPPKQASSTPVPAKTGRPKTHEAKAREPELVQPKIPAPKAAETRPVQRKPARPAQAPRRTERVESAPTEPLPPLPPDAFEILSTPYEP